MGERSTVRCPILPGSGTAISGSLARREHGRARPTPERLPADRIVLAFSPRIGRRLTTEPTADSLCPSPKQLPLPIRQWAFSPAFPCVKFLFPNPPTPLGRNRTFSEPTNFFRTDELFWRNLLPDLKMAVFLEQGLPRLWARWNSSNSGLKSQVVAANLRLLP